MKRHLKLVVVMAFALASCTEDISEDSTNGNWIKYSDYEGNTRSGAVGFTIGEFAYVGLGTDGEDYLTDFWRYDPSRNFWEQMTPFPGTGRISAIGLSINGKGYVGTGFNADLEVEELDDFWEYDPIANSWTQRARFQGGARYSAVAFTVLGKGYVGTGFDGSYLKDFWSYDPTSDSWSQTVSLFGSKREGAVAFVVDDVAYVGAGINNGQFLYDFWSFVPESNSWNDLSLTDDDDTYDEFIAAMGRQDAVAIALDGIAYIATGLAGSYSSAVFSYNPSTNRWSDDWTSFEGTSRGEAVSFVINNKGYIVCGRSASLRHDDIWGFEPDEEYEEFD